MPVFQDSENQPPLLPPGDYIFCVTDFEIGISQSVTTRGCEKYTVELSMEPTGKHVLDFLYDHPKCIFKIDTLLKSGGVQLQKGEAFDFRKDQAERNKVRWVNPLGLRGWCKLKHRKLEAKNGKPERVVNEVEEYYTTKEKLAPRRIEVDEEEKPF
jgi:hypothetical protein